jgi:hypothetical protein
MKKTATIFFLLLMLFSMAGYRFAFSILDNRATVKLDARLDAGDYTEASLIELRVPLNMPYQNRFTEFERQYGEITVDGVLYTYVKMRIDKDVLVLKCIANSAGQQIKNTVNNLAKSNSSQDMEPNGKKHKTSNNQNFSNDYDDKNQSFLLTNHSILIELQFPEFSASVSDVQIKTPLQPPRC